MKRIPVHGHDGRLVGHVWPRGDVTADPVWLGLLIGSKDAPLSYDSQQDAAAGVRVQALMKLKRKRWRPDTKPVKLEKPR